ncbi:hypothetical protein PFISCL1PPCAC_19349 [Pristionchus fissidentatus]|uniref:Uncharacterized protein n=1 Tax=Pristionchus fissidentatus TaxID=1538716 RepID=A0AAV5WAP5_9BILA|nr:hypothetical protein PFISCL1PPCAC_19349 [Pristionchus fissidentatus]
MYTSLPSPSSPTLSNGRKLTHGGFRCTSPSDAAALDFTNTDRLLTPPLSPISRTAKYHIVMKGPDRYERGSDLLSPLETFEHYENRSRPSSAAGQWGSEQIAPQPPTRFTSNRTERQPTKGYSQGVRSAISHRSPTYPQQPPIASSQGNGRPIEYRVQQYQQQQSYAPTHDARGYDHRTGPGTIACEYRSDPRAVTQPLRPLVTDYRSGNGQPGNLACEYRARDISPSVRTVTTTYQPQRKTKLSLPWIICIAISVPVFVVICLFSAVQLQELGIL